jgi:hypothetical protein
MLGHWGKKADRESGVMFGPIPIYIIYMNIELAPFLLIISDHTCLVLFKVTVFDVATQHHKQQCETLQSRGR